MTDQEREARNAEDRKWLDKMASDLDKLRHNREKVPLQELQTRYSKAYNTLVAEVECDADWFFSRYLECLAFPRHPEDKEGNEWLDRRISAILEDEKKPGGRVERYRLALTRDMDRPAFEQLVWEIYDRMEREAFDPYWQRHCRWAGPPNNRWIYNDIFRKWWYGPDRRGEGKTGFWIDKDYKSEDGRFPPNIGEDKEHGTRKAAAGPPCGSQGDQ